MVAVKRVFFVLIVAFIFNLVWAFCLTHLLSAKQSVGGMLMLDIWSMARLARSRLLRALTLTMETIWIARGVYWHLCIRVLVYFTSFDLEKCCSCDYVKIHDGSESYSNVSKLACGRDLPEPVYSSGRCLYITFQSDASIGDKGFVAKYRELSSFSG